MFEQRSGDFAEDPGEDERETKEAAVSEACGSL